MSSFPPVLVALWFRFRTIAEGGRAESKVGRGLRSWPPILNPYGDVSAVLVEVLSKSEITEEMNKIWTKLLDAGLAFVCYDSVSTRGGELRDRKLILPPQVSEKISNSPHYNVRFEIERFGVYDVLMRYIAIGRMSRRDFLELLQSTKVSLGDIESELKETSRHGLTSELSTSELAPFLVKDKEGLINYLHNKFIAPDAKDFLERIRSPEIGSTQKQGKISRKLAEEIIKS